jgi:hypothetical protein
MERLQKVKCNILFRGRCVQIVWLYYIHNCCAHILNTPSEKVGCINFRFSFNNIVNKEIRISIFSYP